MALRVFTLMASSAAVKKSRKSDYVVDEDRGTAEAGAATTITLQASRVLAVDSYLVGHWVVTIGGTGPGQARVITAYVGSTRVATVAAWSVNPDNTTQYVLLEPNTFATFRCTKDSSARPSFGVDRIARILGDKARESSLNGATS